MESGTGHQEEKEEEYEEKDATASTNNIKDGKNSDKANALRSKHSVTEQRRRSRINERFQMLRKLIPHGDQKRDTASFLLEVIQYVQFLQEKVQKYEGSYQSCSSEPTKLMPWCHKIIDGKYQDQFLSHLLEASWNSQKRNNHWNGQSISGQPRNVMNGSGPGSTFPGRFESNSVALPTATQSSRENPVESDAIVDTSCQPIDPVAEVRNKPVSMPQPQLSLPISITNNDAFSDSLPRPASDTQSTESLSAADGMNCHDELTIEGGTISISSIYSEALLKSLTRALQSTGLDLSQASMSVQINLGKQRRPTPETSTVKDHDMPMPSGDPPVRPSHDTSRSEDLDQSQKRLKF